MKLYHGTQIFLLIHAFLTVPSNTFQIVCCKSFVKDVSMTRDVSHRSYVTKMTVSSKNGDLVDSSSPSMYQSYIETVKCQNFMNNAAVSLEKEKSSVDQKNNEVVIHLGDKGPNLVAITGETGSGKYK